MRKLRVFLFLTLMSGGSAFAAAPAGEVRRPNILFVLADNWGWPHAGALGDPLAQTPVFDRIAGTLVDAFVKRAAQVYGE